MEKEGFRHYMLIFYSLRYIPQKDKVKFLRELQGYSERKYGKEYFHSGLIHEFKAEKLGSNVVLVSINHFAEFQKLFSKNNIGIRIKEVWAK